MKTVYFNSREGLRCLSNFSADPVTFNGVRARTAEHAYQWSKFYRSDPTHATLILQTYSAVQAKRAGARQGGGKLDPAWSQERSVKLMRSLLQRKLEQNPGVKASLLATGDAPLVHRAPWDSFWGDGKNGRGKNVLGKLWEEIRSEVRRLG